MTYHKNPILITEIQVNRGWLGNTSAGNYQL